MTFLPIRKSIKTTQGKKEKETKPLLLCVCVCILKNLHTGHYYSSCTGSLY